MLSHRNLAVMSLAYLSEVDPTSPGDAIIHAAPLSHGSGLYSLPHIARLGLNVLPESRGFEASEVFELIHRYRRSSLFAAPTMVRRLTDCAEEVEIEAIRTIIWGGASMPVPDVLRALDRFGPCLAQIYGQGETPMTITILAKHEVSNNGHPRWLERLGSAGRPSSAVEVTVANPEGVLLPDGKTGEVLVRGDTVMSGYWHDQDSTDVALRGGWLHTGDIGSFDEEGYLTLRGRSKEVIISGGSNVYPREVEEVLAAHSSVDDVSVIGRPDPDWGEIVVAYVVGDPSTSGELDQHCLERIARFKRPREYIFVPSLPRNAYGKVVKTELQAIDLQHVNGVREG
jgi:long-chain acyl-CoA synthetase